MIRSPADHQLSRFAREHLEGDLVEALAVERQPRQRLLGDAIGRAVLADRRLLRLAHRQQQRAAAQVGDRHIYLFAIDALVGAIQATLAPRPIDRLALASAVAGVISALLAAGEAAVGPSCRVRTAEELAVMALGPLTWPAERWRVGCGYTPESLGAPSLWSRGRPTYARPLRQWLRARPRQGRAVASVAAVISAAGDLFEQGTDYTVERLAARAGVSVGTVYRYFADKHFALGEFGIAQLARFTERLLSASASIYTDAPSRGVTQLVRLTLDPMRSPLGRRLQMAMFEHGERRIIDQQIEHLNLVLAPVVLQHPLCGVGAGGVPWMLHAVDGVSVWQTGQGGLHDDPLAFGRLVEATAQLVFTYCCADRRIAAAVLRGDAPVEALHKRPGRP